MTQCSPVRPHPLRRIGWGALCWGLCASATAQTVELSGLSAGRALLVVDGAAPRFFSVGQQHQGVKLVSVGVDQAVVAVQGQSRTLRLGESPLNAAPPAPNAGDRRIVLTSDSGGHFTSLGQINGQTVRFLVDTGATVLTLSESEAQRIGLRFREGQAIRVKTANGEITGHQLRLNQVQVAGHATYNVAAVVLPAQLPYVLLGNSFLSRFDMRRENDRMVLEPRY